MLLRAKHAGSKLQHNRKEGLGGVTEIHRQLRGMSGDYSDYTAMLIGKKHNLSHTHTHYDHIHRTPLPLIFSLIFTHS